MGDNLGPNGLSRGCKVSCFRLDRAGIVVHEADQPNAVVILEAERLAGEHGGDVDLLAVHTDAATGGETIHPFLDGNGRLGRLLITLILCEAGVLRVIVASPNVTQIAAAHLRHTLAASGFVVMNRPTGRAPSPSR